MLAAVSSIVILVRRVLLSGAEYSAISKVMRGPFGAWLPGRRLSLYCAFLNRVSGVFFNLRLPLKN
jgi:hypothetical protein